MTIEELRITQDYKRLTEQEAAFIEAYIINGGNILDAAKAAFNCANDQSARVYGRRVMNRPQINNVLRVFLGEEVEGGRTIDDLRDILWTNVRDPKCPPAVKSSFTKQIAEIEGWTKAKPQEQHDTSALEGLI